MGMVWKFIGFDCGVCERYVRGRDMCDFCEREIFCFLRSKEWDFLIFKRVCGWVVWSGREWVWVEYLFGNLEGFCGGVFVRE